MVGKLGRDSKKKNSPRTIINYGTFSGHTEDNLSSCLYPLIVIRPQQYQQRKLSLGTGKPDPSYHLHTCLID